MHHWEQRHTATATPTTTMKIRQTLCYSIPWALLSFYIPRDWKIIFLKNPIYGRITTWERQWRKPRKITDLKCWESENRLPLVWESLKKPQVLLIKKERNLKFCGDGERRETEREILWRFNYKSLHLLEDKRYTEETETEAEQVSSSKNKRDVCLPLLFLFFLF